jgi:hypothetical protein
MRARLVPVLLAAVVVLAGCSSGDDDGADATASTTTAGTTAAGGGATTAPGGGCPATGYALTDVVSAPTLDVDDDGAPDTEWIASQPAPDGSVQFGIQTASGDAIAANLQSASPVARSILVADVTGSGEIVVLASDGRQVLLYAYSECEIVPVQNPQGEQYAFDLGFTGYGTGVGCTDLDGDGVRDLVGFRADDDGTGYTATAVVLDGPRASNSDVGTSVSDAGPDEVATARSVTCGDLTLPDDGVTTAP